MGWWGFAKREEFVLASTPAPPLSEATERGAAEIKVRPAQRKAPPTIQRGESGTAGLARSSERTAQGADEEPKRGPPAKTLG